MHETNITFDYEIRQIRVFTTREGCYNGFVRRLGAEHVDLKEKSRNSWRFNVSMDVCRGPEMIAKLINPEQKQPMPQSLIEKFKSAV
jgi:hypothetical protein